jgi:hypothetical protein
MNTPVPWYAFFWLTNVEAYWISCGFHIRMSARPRQSLFITAFRILYTWQFNVDVVVEKGAPCDNVYSSFLLMSRNLWRPGCLLEIRCDVIRDVSESCSVESRFSIVLFNTGRSVYGTTGRSLYRSGLVIQSLCERNVHPRRFFYNFV